MGKKGYKTASRAFTLIELLVVVSIISLLSSIVMTAVNSAREKARIAAARQLEASFHHTYGSNAVGLWDFDEGAGSAANDRSGNGFHGTVSGVASWVPGIDGGTALRFDGTNYVQLPSLGSRSDLVGGYSTGKILFMAWIRPTQYTGGTYSMFGNGFPGYLYFGVNPSRRLLLMVNCPMGTQGCLPSNNNYWPESASTIPLDQWTHIAFLMEAGIGYKFYINGKLDKEVKDTNLTIANMGGAQTAIGRTYSGNTAEFFRGDIDSVRFYYASL